MNFKKVIKLVTIATAITAVVYGIKNIYDNHIAYLDDEDEDYDDESFDEEDYDLDFFCGQE